MKMFSKCILILTTFTLIESAKILIVVPTPSISHQVVFRPIIQELIDRNHEVVVVTPDPIYAHGKSPNNLSEIDVHNVSYKLWHEMVNVITKCDEVNFLSLMTKVFCMRSKIFQKQLREESVKNLIRNNSVKFDLLILEACTTSSLIFSHIFKAPVIQMSSFGAIPGNMKMVGGLVHPFLYPTHYHKKLYNISLGEKINELYNHAAIEQIIDNQELEDDRSLQRLFGMQTPPLSKLKNNVHMLFLNIHPIWVHNQPVPNNVVYIWGIHRTTEKMLPKDLQSYLDSSKNGVIYISFGTNFKSSLIPSKRLEVLIDVFSELPYDILWKWDVDELPRKSENIKISKWFPQCDILRHPNLKLFITQGGLQSTEEAINAGVPLIGIPIFADQDYNTEKYVYFKIGVKLNFKYLTAETFKNAIMTIFTNYESYRKNIIQLRTQMQDLPKPALDNAIRWIEYVLRHDGAKHLRAPAANKSWAEYYELELILIVLTSLIISATVLLLTVFNCFKFMSADYFQSIFLQIKSYKSEYLW